jgi:hypothetical protein
MKRIADFKETLTLKEISSIVGGGDSRWICTEDTSGGQCGDTRTVVSCDDGTLDSDTISNNKCPEPLIANVDAHVISNQLSNLSTSNAVTEIAALFPYSITL